MEQLLQKYPNDLRFVYRQYPLIGTPENPTPTGTFYFTDPIDLTTDPGTAYGALNRRRKAVISRLRIQGAPLGVQKIDASSTGIVVQFIPEPPVEPRKILALVQSSRIYRLPGPDRVRIEMKHEDLRQRANEVRQFLKKLA